MSAATPPQPSAEKKTNPFIEKTVRCPICGNQESQPRIKSNLFAERGRDIDMRPLEYATTVKGLEQYHPPLYYIWYCSKCLFAAAHMFYEEPFSDSSMTVSKIKQGIANEKGSPAAKKVFNLLSSSIDAIPRDHLQGVKLHLLAAYNLAMVEEIAQANTMNLGRYYLRTAWLYHEIFSSPEIRTDFGGRVSALTSSLQADWKSVPTSETEALQAAVLYLERAVVSSYAIKTPLEQVELFLLVARIHMKLGDIPAARKYLQTGKESARKSQEQIEKQIRSSSPELSPQKATELRGMVRKLEAVADHAQNTFEDVRGEWEAKQIDKGNSILEKHPNKPQEELRAILIAQGVDEVIANKLTRSEKKKKGLFGLFG